MMFAELMFPDVLPYLFAILALLIVWQYHQVQVINGRILAIDIFDRSGVRFYLYVTPGEDALCPHCAASNGTVYLPSQVARKDFCPSGGPCLKTTPCPGVLVGLYGSWLEARGVLERVRQKTASVSLRLSQQELRGLVNGQWERSISAETDRLAIQLLEAMSYETVNSELAIAAYRFTVEQAKEIRHLMLLVPAYLRLIHLLIQTGRREEAWHAIERFETRFPVNKRGRHFPSSEQRDAVRLHKSRLVDSRALPLSA
ncbi:MAG: hypothetical protein AB7G48_15860 [Nitrospiraceae bacterium]